MRLSDEQLAVWRELAARLAGSPDVQTWTTDRMTAVQAFPELVAEVRELRQRAEQAEAQMAMLVGKLIDVATGYRRDAAEEGCDAGNFDGGSTDTCAHCQLLQQAEGIDSLLATLPASANQMLEREQAMREALEWYAEDGRYMLTRWTDYGGGTFSEAEVSIDHGRRAREALREEDTANRA